MFKKLLIAIAFLGVGILGVTYYYWRQATSLPTWYQGQSSDPQKYLQPSELPSPKTDQTNIMAATKQTIQKKVQTTIQQQGNIQPQQDIKVTLKTQDFNQLIQSEISNKLRSRSRETLPNIQANIEKNNLEIGTVINTNKLENLELPRQQQAMIERVVTKFPQIKDQDIYVGIEGKPKLKNGQLTLPNNSQVKIGKLTFTLSEIAQKLGVSTERLQQGLDLDINSLNLRDLQLTNDEVILKVNPSDYVPQ